MSFSLYIVLPELGIVVVVIIIIISISISITLYEHLTTYTHIPCTWNLSGTTSRFPTDVTLLTADPQYTECTYYAGNIYNLADPRNKVMWFTSGPSATVVKPVES